MDFQRRRLRYCSVAVFTLLHVGLLTDRTYDESADFNVLSPQYKVLRNLRYTSENAEQKHRLDNNIMYGAVLYHSYCDRMTTARLNNIDTSPFSGTISIGNRDSQSFCLPFDLLFIPGKTRGRPRKKLAAIKRYEPLH